MIAALKAGIRRTHPLRDEVARHTQAFVREVAMDGEAGLGAKHAHHIILAEVKCIRQRVDADILGQVRVEIFENGCRFLVAVLGRGIVHLVVVQPAAEHDQQLQHLRPREQVMPVGRALLLRLERLERAQQRRALPGLRPQDKALPIRRQAETGVQPGVGRGLCAEEIR